MLDGLVDLADKLGILTALKEKLFKNREVDTGEFVSELNKITPIIKEIDSITARFLTLSFRSDEKGNLTEARKFLIELEGGSISMQGPTVRAHCERLRSIYAKDLDPYFRRVLSDDELEKGRQAFASLEDFHSNTLL